MNLTRSVYTANSSSDAAARELVAGLDGADPRVVVFFAGIKHDGALLGQALERRFPDACVIGCSGNGEFCDRGHGNGGVTALAISGAQVGACAAAMIESGDLDASMRRAAEQISTRLGRPLRELDPERWTGLALLEGARGNEERINAAFGDIAPFLPIVGGSAGDDITFSGTWTWADGQLVRDGTALLVAEMLVPFRVVKTCNFVPTERTVEVTRTDAARRLILEFDGEPAAQYYARALGVAPDQLDFARFLEHPLGLMIDGEPWLRSCVRREGDAVFFACAVVEGARLNFMQSTHLVDDTRARLERVQHELGTPIRGAIFFNCAYRMIEAQIKGLDRALPRDALAVRAHRRAVQRRELPRAHQPDPHGSGVRLRVRARAWRPGRRPRPG
jgi:hypothetical protein